MIKLTSFFYLLFIVFSISAQTNRMWVPSESQRAYNMMRENGAQFNFEDLYDPVKPSFNDAIVLFNGGCTAEIISPQGLLLTNHHCGYGAISEHSTLAHNYVEEGFWAKSFEEELPNPGMTVTIVRQIINVTDKVLAGISDALSNKERQSLIDKNINRVKKELKDQIDPWQNIQIKPYLYGNLYYALITETFEDIRLVGAPPSSIGKFGADTDNWMWPRHSGDFALFRIYADQNNKPAKFSPDNVPYKPSKYLKISTEGVEEGDFILVYGFPGRTQQYLPSFVIEKITQEINPAHIEARERALKIMDKYMRANDTIKLKYTSHFARVANYWKKWKGENLGIQRSGAIENKKHLEKTFLEYAQAKGFADQAREVLEQLKQINDSMISVEKARSIWLETVYLNNDWFRRAVILYGLERKGKENFDKNKQSVYQRFVKELNATDKRVSKELFIQMMDYYKKFMPTVYKNNKIREVNIVKLADEIEKNSVLNDSIKLKKWLSGDFVSFENTLKNDSGYILARALINDYYQNISPAYNQMRQQFNQHMRLYTDLLQKSGLYAEMVPDANGTLRLSFGQVKGYAPRDGIYYEPISTLEGVMEKYIPGDYEFDLPEKLLEIYREKDFGDYVVNGTVPVNFLGTAHTTGGNSGSPALNAKGELVGLNFDRVWEGTMSDLYYDPAICRNIMVDLRYILFIIDKLGNAQNILNEIKTH